MTKTTHTVRISCSCKTCKTNAEYVGAAFPLVAYIRPEAARVLGITDRTANTAKYTHGTVYLAHDPVVGPHQRMAIAG